MNNRFVKSYLDNRNIAYIFSNVKIGIYPQLLKFSLNLPEFLKIRSYSQLCYYSRKWRKTFEIGKTKAFILTHYTVCSIIK